VAKSEINPSNAELNPICHLLALLGAHHILHVSRVKVNDITKKQKKMQHRVPGLLPDFRNPIIFFVGIDQDANSKNTKCRIQNHITHQKYVEICYALSYFTFR